MAAECGITWPELPKDGRVGALVAVVTDARTYFLLADTPESASSWLTKLTIEWTRFRPERYKDMHCYL